MYVYTFTKHHIFVRFYIIMKNTLNYFFKISMARKSRFAIVVRFFNNAKLLFLLNAAHLDRSKPRTIRRHRTRRVIGDSVEKEEEGEVTANPSRSRERTPPSTDQSGSRDRVGIGGALIGGTRRVDEFRSTRRVIFKPSADPVPTVRSRNVVSPANENQYFRRVARQRAQRLVAICRAITRALPHDDGAAGAVITGRFASRFLCTYVRRWSTRIESSSVPRKETEPTSTSGNGRILLPAHRTDSFVRIPHPALAPRLDLGSFDLLRASSSASRSVAPTCPSLSLFSIFLSFLLHSSTFRPSA